MPLVRLGQTLLYFAHIPKTGGSSLESYLAARGAMALYHSKSLSWLACSPQHIHAALQQVLFPARFFDHSFAVLRDPLVRMQSEYAYRAARAARNGRRFRPFDAWVPRVLAQYQADPFALDNHLRPQHEFVTPDMRLFRFEDGLGPVFDWIDSLAPDPGSDSQTAPPRPWKKKTDASAIAMTQDTEAQIRAFYAADERLIAEQGWAGPGAP